MKKLNAKLAIQNTDRITIYNTGDRIEFYYNNSNRREGATCFYEIPFSLSGQEVLWLPWPYYRRALWFQGLVQQEAYQRGNDTVP